MEYTVVYDKVGENLKVLGKPEFTEYINTKENNQAQQLSSFRKIDETVSIVLPARNIEKYIGRCLNSLINQTYKYLEIVVVDDGSTDKTLDMIESYVKLDNRITCIKGKALGTPMARNTGIKNATGKYLMMIDGDDELPLKAIENMVIAFHQVETDCVMGGTDQIFPDGSVIHFGYEKGLVLKNNIEQFSSFVKYIYSGEFVSCPMLIREKVVDLFDEEVGLWDNNLFLLKYLLNAERIYTFPENVYKYYYMQRPNSSIAKLKSDKYWMAKDTLIAFPKYLDTAKKLFPKNKTMWQLIASIMLIIAYSYFKNFSNTKEVEDKQCLAKFLNSREMKQFSKLIVNNSLEGKMAKLATQKGDVELFAEYCNLIEKDVKSQEKTQIQAKTIYTPTQNSTGLSDYLSTTIMETRPFPILGAPSP